ncbi:helix-turn-helix domain-containing protein [Anaerobacillus isosaccharinicus]|uniref:Helix-turn-helix transcriptional regulator n=1 Tax=Anaerobacillus isosaccharinicus TaxID=1532552 RepID=A0A1S2KYB4_9BACI|nr:helix-turn-helix transcriptional regulator [Anaerobacillus isosaccharinicus]QOY37680.1 helix-turn-helix transcriptional regulator [Anaerobacillus isosaccharinicus]
MVDRNLNLKREISNNLKQLLKERKWTQSELSMMSGIPTSTISDYLNCKSLIHHKNVKYLSLIFKVEPYRIDPSFNSEQQLKLDELEDWILELNNASEKEKEFMKNIWFSLKELKE